MGLEGPKKGLEDHWRLEDQQWGLEDTKEEAGELIVGLGRPRGASEDPEGVWRTEQCAEEPIVEFGGPLEGDWRTNSGVWRTNRGSLVDHWRVEDRSRGFGGPIEGVWRTD